MKRLKIFWNFSLTLMLVLGLSWPALTQTGNQSDGFPNVNETTITTPSEAVNPTVDQPGESSTETTSGSVDRGGFEGLVQAVDSSEAVQLFEEAQTVEFSDYFNNDFYGKTPSIDEIAKALCGLAITTGQKSVVMYVFSLENELQTLTIFPQDPAANSQVCQPVFTSNTQSFNKELLLAQEDQIDPSVQKIIPEAKREILEKTLQKFRLEVTNPRKIGTTSYRQTSQQLYNWIIAPIEPDLQANNINTIVFALDTGLRSTPIAAFYDGKQFLVEKYALALIPSFGLTDSRYTDVRTGQILAGGAAEFKDLNSLPAVPIELTNILRGSWKGKKLLNEEFTLENFKQLNKQEHFSIIHLATHGEFEPGKISNSYIQFWNTKLHLDDLKNVAQELGWTAGSTQPVELMVLSACRTALGNKEAELGFAGLAVQAGVKSALASLWYVSDAGTLGLMNEFYQRYSTIPNKAEALRQSQLAMLRGQVNVEGSELRGSNAETLQLPPELAVRTLNLSHPYFWSAFTLIGNWN